MSDLATEARQAVEEKGGSAPSVDKFFWYELITSDQDAALDFYTRVVGWRATEAPGSDMSGMRYMILNAGDRGMGGVMQINDDMKAHGARPAWIGYIHAADVDARVAAVKAAGGSVQMPPTDLPGVGRIAMVADPAGAPFYLMTPRPPEGTPPMPPAEPTGAVLPTTPGLVSWHELYSAQGDRAAFDFYSGLFGWETMAEMDMGPMGTYRIFGGEGVQMGGIMNKPENVPVSAWGFYVNVDGLDAAVERVTSNGGKIVMGPMEVPGGSWVIQGIDPQGAAFALVSTRR
jgi:predicted enzyme related to lactoylglutathione lyase